ncbi:HAD-IIA family hydrolase [Clostridium sp. Marseille-P2415]|uniref:HAD-IIA family hydrolase n=1 Tax=Clostridium sp. Marseille-P2415 TaxID=1805471 RepID=UPI000988460C|nr:HAD-IIA family hydrolase [Clostridium sp. Marseille-P2415]
MNKKNKKDITYLFDLDGTLTLEDDATPYAPELIGFLNDHRREFYIITNGCALSSQNICEKLKNLNMEVKTENIITAADVLTDILNECYKNDGIFVAGAEWLKSHLLKSGFRLVSQDPKVVVVSYDKNTRFAEIEDCIRFIHDGAVCLSTNDDFFIPGMRHSYPHTGFINAVIEDSLKRKPGIVGKPSPHFLVKILKRSAGRSQHFCVVGDNMATDIAFAKNCGMMSYLVLTGITGRDDIAEDDVNLPDRIFDNLKGLLELEKSHYNGE